jgi:hypothetical protein
MKIPLFLIAAIIIFAAGCSNNSVGPLSGSNLLANSTFEVGGLPSINGWNIADSITIKFVTEKPRGGAGYTLVLKPEWSAPWPANSLYTAVTNLSGTHTFRLSVYAKKVSIGGGVYVYRNRPTVSAGSTPVLSLPITGTSWALYSATVTLSVANKDSLFVSLTGGASEGRIGATYFNTCQFERMD